MPRKLSFAEGMAMNRASGVFTEEELKILAESPAQEAAHYLFEGKVPSRPETAPAPKPAGAP